MYNASMDAGELREALGMSEGQRGFIQIGVTALRDPVTGDFLPAVPLYIRAEDRQKACLPTPCTENDLARCLAQKMKAYIDGCKNAGVPI